MKQYALFTSVIIRYGISICKHFRDRLLMFGVITLNDDVGVGSDDGFAHEA